jgi:hypothetical protein
LARGALESPRYLPAFKPQQAAHIQRIQGTKRMTFSLIQASKNQSRPKESFTGVAAEFRPAQKVPLSELQVSIG